MNYDYANGGMDWMMAGMWLVWLLVVVALIFGIAALFKYLRNK